jgi:murein DD-endopeptidase MepM/ murein hydrolase activator NlpD
MEAAKTRDFLRFPIFKNNEVKKMAAIYRFKRYENRIVKKSKNFGKFLREKAAAFFKAAGRMLRRSYTLVFIHHSEKKFRNLHINFLTLCCFFLLQCALIGLVVWQGFSFRNSRKIIADKDIQLKIIRTDFDQLQDESADLFREIMDFEAALSGASGILNREPGAVSGLSNDLYARIHSKKDLYSYEIRNIRQVKDYLSSVIRQAADIQSTLDFQNTMLREIPSIWPIKGGIGHISTTFGPNRHPYTGQYYLHRGLDFSTYRQGDPIVAAADGQVVTAEYDQVSGFGNYMVIRHKHGYYTRYGHMMSFAAAVGQEVRRGDVIGHIGNTGLSTGPHLHYEVHIGSEVADPQKFIYLRSGASPAALLAQVP